MSATPHAAVGDHARLARSLARLMTMRYSLALGTVALLAFLGQVVIQVTLVHITGEDPVQAARSIQTLRILELGLFVLLLITLYLEARWVFRPTVRRIATALTDLERVKRWAVEQEVAEASGRLERRIGSDLHDGVGQRLTGISMMAKALAKRLPEGDERAQAQAIASEMAEAISETRTLARELFPSAAEPLGLAAAIRDLAASTTRRAGITCVAEWDDDLSVPELEDGSETPAPMHIYRIVQEAIANSLRHGQATRIVISARSTAEGTRITIHDNGIGLRATAGGDSLGLGVRSMGYRCRLLQVTLEITDHPDGGVVVQLAWPPASMAPCTQMNPDQP
jgi:signal transduction histidine kinase